MLALPIRRLSLDEDNLEREGDALVRFRLTYDGPLRPTQDRDLDSGHRAIHKHALRQHFHCQLKQFWADNKFLNTTRMLFKPGPTGNPLDPYGSMRWGHSPDELVPIVDAVAALYHQFGYRYVPLVREDWSLTCSLRILFLRRDPPGSVISAGDIDNRVKTIVDALSKPANAKQVPVGPGPDEDPFFVLLEDDKLVSHLEVETDTLLDPPVASEDRARSRIVVTVDIRPYNVNTFNLSFSA
jgi:hypothetical protein